MKLDKMLATIRASEATPAEKTASAKTPAVTTETKTASAANPLENALKSALAEVNGGSDKTASETKTSPVDDVMKIASQMAGAETEAAVKEAQLLGAAFADSVIARFNEWNEKTGGLKTAAATATVAAVPGVPADLVKQAEQVGYEKAKLELEKQANELYQKGFNDTVEQIHSIAAGEFMKAAQLTASLLQDAR
jgi:hypothetical protein